jgi:hypothetical protein
MFSLALSFLKAYVWSSFLAVLSKVYVKVLGADWIKRKYYVFMCEKEEWDMLKLFQDWGERGKKENGGRGEFNSDTLEELL